MWLTVNFLVCVLCLQALVVPPSVELSALFLTSGIHWSGGSHTGTITPIDHRKGEDIKGVCHTYTPRTHLLFSFKSLFIRGKSIEHACVKQCHASQLHCRDIQTWAARYSICWRVNGCCGVHQSYRGELVIYNYCLHCSGQTDEKNGQPSSNKPFRLLSHNARMYAHVNSHCMEISYLGCMDGCRVKKRGLYNLKWTFLV